MKTSKPNPQSAIRNPQFFGVILAGGRGTRFWPRSRRRHAKQVLNIVGESTMIQQTVERLRPMIPPERIWVITNEYLRNVIAKQLPDVPRAQIIAEPVQRNTAPAIGLAAQLIARTEGRNAVMGVFPSDHVIARPAVFQRVLKVAVNGAREGAIVVLGIRPRWAETGYGYIEFAQPPSAESRLQTVARFREKPDPATARRFLKSGRHYWNSGMFVWTTGTILDALALHKPEMAELLGFMRFFPRRLAELYPQCENISVDYAVLERAANVMGVPCDIGWNDVGSWNAVYELLPRDDHKNAARGPVFTLDAAGNYFDAPGKLVAAIGVDNLVVVDAPGAILVARRDRAHQVSQVVTWLEKQKRDDLL